MIYVLSEAVKRIYGCEGGFGEEWTHVYVRLSPFTIHLKLS